MSAESLRHLAAEVGVATDFWDWQGQHVDVPDATLAAVLAARAAKTFNQPDIEAPKTPIEVSFTKSRRVFSASVFRNI